HPPKWTGYQLLALIFGTLLSSQGTDASFVLTLSGFPPGFRSVLAFPTLSDSFVSDFLGAFQVFAFAFSLSGGADSIRSFPPDFPASKS
ncbi:hypothetical protein ACFWB2_29510, partial [Streptomyces virginiae]|uniref:hypothetical protein n=5 Tax=Streptomyces virginiae TaxID=1961 RepID=UPI0036CC6758